MCQRVLLILTLVLLQTACKMAADPAVPTTAATAAISAELPLPTATPVPTPTSVPTATLAPTAVSTATTMPSATPSPTSAETPTPSVEPTATYWPTVTRQLLPDSVAAGLTACDQRSVSPDLLTVVTQQFGLPPSYQPPDLVPLADHVGNDVVRGEALLVSASIVGPLTQMVNDMHAAGLQPSILSAYRGYDEQAMAWHWWSGQYPDRVAIMSARAGHSEHQLGTTIDFGSPEIDHLFHVDFANTAEGLWLAQNAPSYGFTMTYPDNTYATTGFKYEPWHFRYVGAALSAELAASGQHLTQWQLANLPPPCIP